MRDSRNSMPALIESLEYRQLLSATLFKPGQVEGTYKGDSVSSDDGTRTVVKVTITSTSETIDVTGIGSRKVTLTAQQFKKLREGEFAFSGKVGAYSFEIEGSFTHHAVHITGAYSDKIPGHGNGGGTFSLTKIAGA